MASIEELYNKSEISKKVAKKIDRTPISADDYDHAKLSIDSTKLDKSRGGVLGNLVGGFNPTKKYSDSVKR